MINHLNNWPSELDALKVNHDHHVLLSENIGIKDLHVLTVEIKVATIK